MTIQVHAPHTETMELTIHIVTRHHGREGWRATVVDPEGRKITRTGFHRTCSQALSAALRTYADGIDYWW